MLKDKGRLGSLAIRSLPGVASSEVIHFAAETSKHPKNDEHARALYFNAAGQRIKMAEHTNSKPKFEVSVDAMAEHVEPMVESTHARLTPA
jgi:hypothetical protein